MLSIRSHDQQFEIYGDPYNAIVSRRAQAVTPSFQVRVPVVSLAGRNSSGATAVRAELRQRFGPSVDHVSTCVLPGQLAVLGDPRPELATAKVLHGHKERGTYLMRLRPPLV